MGDPETKIGMEGIPRGTETPAIGIGIEDCNLPHLPDTDEIVRPRARPAKVVGTHPANGLILSLLALPNRVLVITVMSTDIGRGNVPVGRKI